MTATLARSVQSVELRGDNKLRVVFPADSKVTMRRIDLPEHKTALLDAMARLSGRELQLEFAAAPAPRWSRNRLPVIPVKIVSSGCEKSKATPLFKPVSNCSTRRLSKSTSRVPVKRLVK